MELSVLLTVGERFVRYWKFEILCAIWVFGWDFGLGVSFLKGDFGVF